jgi:hypothetical protein
MNEMTCTHCCGADQLFDLKGAEKELKKYKKKGPGSVTKRLIDYLSDNNKLEGKSLLDIGGGIGSIQWDFLKRGGSKTIDVDASNGYQQVAKALADEQDYSEKATFVPGDFVDKSAEIPKVDFVTMDKVLCCYPDYQSLLEAALNKCNESIIISFPLGGPIAGLYVGIENFYFKLRNIAFSTFIHPPKQIESFITDHGFEITQKSISFPWHIQAYRRIS